MYFFTIKKYFARWRTNFLITEIINQQASSTRCIASNDFRTIAQVLLCLITCQPEHGGCDCKVQLLVAYCYNIPSLPLALCGDLGLRASRASGIDHERELHQRVTAISELVVLAVLHSRQLKHSEVTQIMLIRHYIYSTTIIS